MVECICPRCKRNFIKAPQNIFKDERGDYCGWTCYNHRNDGVANHQKYHKVEQYHEDGKTLIKTHDSAIKAAEAVNGTANHIRGACRTLTLYKGFIWRYKNDLS